MPIDCDLMQLFYINHSIHEPWHSIFIFLYGILILTAFIFNSLVLYAVYRSCRRPEIDTIIRTRIILIGHLCTFPLSLIQKRNLKWMKGKGKCRDDKPMLYNKRMCQLLDPHKNVISFPSK